MGQRRRKSQGGQATVDTAASLEALQQKTSYVIWRRYARERSFWVRRASAACSFLLLMSSLFLIYIVAPRQGGLTTNQSHLGGHSRRELLQSEEFAEDGRSFFQWQPRRNYAGDDVSGEFCGYRNGECEFQNYAESISLLTLPAICVGVFLFFLFITLMIVLHSLHCCCHIDLCWTQRRCEAIVLKTCVIIPVIIMLAMLSMAIVGNVWVNKGMNDFLDGMVSFVDELYGVANTTNNVLSQVGVDISETFDQVTSARRTFHQYKGWVYDAETARMIALFCLYGFFASFLVVTLLLLMCDINCPTSVIIFCLSMVMFVMVFTILPLSVAGGAVGSDICDLYEETSQGETPASLDRLLGSLGVNCSTFEDAFDPLLDYANSSMHQGCDSYEEYCTNCGGCLGTCSTCDGLDDLVALQNQTLDEVYTCDNSTGACQSGSCTGSCIGNSSCVCFNRTLTIRQCATNCLADPYLSNAETIIEYVDLAVLYNTTLNQVRPYLGCQVFSVWAAKTEEPLCVDLLAGVFITFLGMAAFGLPWVLFMLAIMMLGDRNRLGGTVDDDDSVEMLEKTSRMKDKEKHATFRKNETVVWNS